MSGTVTLLAVLALLFGCARVRVEPVEVEVKPIHVTVDVNVKIEKVDRALNEFFSDITPPSGEEVTPAVSADKSLKEEQI